MMNTKLDVGKTRYHLALGRGEITRILEDTFEIKFNTTILLYKYNDVGRLVFKSDTALWNKMSDKLDIPYYDVVDMYEHKISKDIIVSKYYVMFHHIFMGKKREYYRLIPESIKSLIEYDLIDTISDLENKRIYNQVNKLLDERDYYDAINVSINLRSSDALEDCILNFVSNNKSNWERILRLYRVAINLVLKYESTKCYGNEKQTKLHDKRNMFAGIVNTFMKLPKDDYLLMLYEDLSNDKPLIQTAVDKSSERLTKKIFPIILNYYLNFYSEYDCQGLLDRLIDFANSNWEAYCLLNKYINPQTRRFRKEENEEEKIRLALIMEQEEKEREKRKAQYKADMKEFLEKHQISNLIHFTNIENINSIIRCGGLWPRFIHEDINVDAAYSDDLRLDNRLDATSLSITYPNYKLLYSKRYSNSNGYAILIFDSKILYEEDNNATFYYNNAASNRGKLWSGTSIKAFENLFNNSFRSENTPENCTTNSQAEIMMEDIVSIKYLKEIHVISKSCKEKLLKEVENEDLKQKIIVDNYYFNFENGKKIWDKEESKNGCQTLF